MGAEVVERIGGGTLGRLLGAVPAARAWHSLRGRPERRPLDARPRVIAVSR